MSQPSNTLDQCNETASLLVGDSLSRLREIPDGSARCCVTSPPYWGLRDYGVEGQLGLEQSPYEYVENLVTLFREVRRVLAPDGTLWLNLGDSYFNASPVRQSTANMRESKYTGGLISTGARRRRSNDHDLKMKDLVGIPWMTALALRKDGWYLRNDVIWAKPNPMPEGSVTDRLTRSHEHVFLLSKAPKYFFDQDAIKEPCAIQPDPNATSTSERARNRKSSASNNGRSQQVTNSEAECRDQPGNFNNNPRLRTATHRNKRDVWTITPKPFKGAHFAVFPPALVEPCVLAGSQVGDVVLDPFTGSGTTGAVARAHGRRFLGIELNPEYAAMAWSRITGA